VLVLKQQESGSMKSGLYALFIFLVIIVFFFFTTRWVEDQFSRFFFRNAQEIDDQYAREAEWFHSPEYRSDRDQSSPSTPSGKPSSKRHLQEAFSEHIAFSLISNHPLSPKNKAEGQASTYLRKMEEGKMQLGKQWYDNANSYFLLKPIPRNESCTVCHTQSPSVLCGAIIWTLPKGNIHHQINLALIGAGLFLLIIFIVLLLIIRKTIRRKTINSVKRIEECTAEIARGSLITPLQKTGLSELRNIEDNLEKIRNSMRIALKKLSER
jgi:HAMP domain-containing protein